MRTIFLTLLLGLAIAAMAAKPAVLFVGGVHPTYTVKPLLEMGIAVDSCAPGELATRLASQRYNVVVANATNDPAHQQVLEAFMAQGGGVLVTQPFGHISRQNDWFPNPEWVAGYGARLRFEQLAETDPANGYTDFMGAPMSWSTQVSAPVNDGVSQVLTLVARLGWWPPLGFDFSDDWTVVARFAPTVKGTIPKDPPERLRPYLPEKPTEGSLPLMGVRAVGAGRMALVGISPSWSFDAPGICPTVETMLTKGANGKSSDWLRLYANTFRWLAEPSLKKGYGGATTPERLINPAKQWPDAAPWHWDTANVNKNYIPMGDMPQLQGLVGARTALSGGTGTVADYANAARAAGLDYLVFLEDALQMDAAKFETLVADCTKASDDTFAAIPGLLYQDAQGNHLYTFGDNTKFPRPEMVLPDGRLKTTTVSRTEVLFDYIFQYQNYRNAFGFWNHDKNFLPVADYKLYNSFPIYTFENGKPVDSAFDDYLYLMGWGGSHAVFAFELMTSPDQVAKRATAGWRVVATIPEKFGDGTYTMSLSPGVKGLREKWVGSLGWWPPFQYITNGPQILSWDCQNICALPSGEWWRPDLWQYRARLHVASETGLKTVTLYDGDRGIYRQWRLNGAKDFAHDLVLAHDTQRDLVLVVEDTAGQRAIGMELWNRNTMNNQFICGDRCNFLGNQRLRKPDGSAFWLPAGFRANMGVTPSKGSMSDGLWVEPAVTLTPGAPTLPIDGKPLSWPSPRLEINPMAPGEYREVHTYPTNYLVSPEMGIGQADYKLAYAPEEYGALKTPLGHDYQVGEQKLPNGTVKVTPQGQIGKNAWTSWYKLIPTQVMSGWSRIYAGTAYDSVRVGGYQGHLVMKRDVAFEPGMGMQVLATTGAWELFANGKPVEMPANGEITGAFGKGTVAVLTTPGGSVVLAGTDGRLRYRRTARGLFVDYLPANDALKQGEAADITLWWMGINGLLPREQVLQAARDFGVLVPGAAGYTPKVTRGQTTDTYFWWTARAKDGALEATIPQAPLANYIPLALDGLNDNWSVFLLDKARKGPNFRTIPLRDGRAIANIDPINGKADLFVGHPVTANTPDVKLLVAWKSPGAWFVEAHNPTAQPMPVTLTANKGWTLFRFKETITLAPGASRVWEVKGK